MQAHEVAEIVMVVRDELAGEEVGGGPGGSADWWGGKSSTGSTSPRPIMLNQMRLACTRAKSSLSGEVIQSASSWKRS